LCGQAPAGNPWDSDLQLDDDLLETLDPSTLPSGAKPCRPPQLVLVDHAFDGDTLFVMKEPEGEILPHVRVIGVDTPELAHGGEPAECYALQATEFTSQLEGHLAWLTFDAECEDIYGRLLACVYVGPGTQDSLERQLLRRGLATAYPVRKNRTFQRLFEADERQAAGAKLGLWGNCP
jgi:micrococcal nuclease